MSEQQSMIEQDAVQIETFQYANENELAQRRARQQRDAVEKSQRVARYTFGAVRDRGQYRLATATDQPKDVVKVVLFASLNKSGSGFRKFRATLDGGAKIDESDLRAFVDNKVAFGQTVRHAFLQHFERVGAIEAGYVPAMPASLHVGF